MSERKTKPKPITVELLDPEHSAYQILKEIIAVHHSHLAEAEFVLAWKYGWSADADGRMTLARVKKCSELERSMHHADFCILINHENWNSAKWSEGQMRALLDHELCHCQVTYDVNSDPRVDEKGRTIYRIRKHDVEEFQEIVARYGAWKGDLQDFIDAAEERRSIPMPQTISHRADAGARSAGG